MGDLSAHFSKSEFACKCGVCGYEHPESAIVLLLEEGRRHFKEKYGLKVRVKINSGIRCRAHNETVQKEYNADYIPGSSKSRHMEFDAADVVFEIMEFSTSEWFPIDPKEVYEFYDKRYPGMLGLGLYDDRNHIDGRLTKARWDNRS